MTEIEAEQQQLAAQQQAHAQQVHQLAVHRARADGEWRGAPADDALRNAYLEA